jgi:predicted porin
MMLGRHDTPYKLATGKLDIFADTAADYNAIIGNVAGVNVADLRADAMVAYISPNWSGFHFAVAYVDGVGLGTDLEAEAWSMMGMYENGPLFLSGAWEHVETDNATLPSTPFGTIENPETDAYKLGAGYKFGNFQVGFIYEKIEADSDDPIIEDFSRDAWYLNGQYTMGNIVLKGFWGMADEIEDIDDSGTDFYGLGADYNLSKRTKLFALYTAVDNDDNGSYRTSSTGYAFAEGEKQSVFSVGMVHTF